MRILIIKPSSLGDIIHGLVVAASIRRQLPEARIDWVARDIFAPLVRRARCVDTVFTFSRSGGIGGFFETVRNIRRAGCYDWVLDMQGLARSAAMTRLACGHRKVGRPDAREGGRLLVPRVVRRPSREPAHAVERLLPFLEVLGLRSDGEYAVEFAPNEREESMVGGRYIVLFPESRRQEKEWPHFGELGQLLAQQVSGCTIVWSGTDSSLPLPAGESILDWRAKVPLAGLTGLIGRASLVVANDSGPMHLAAALGRPTVGLFGPTDPRLYGPWPVDAPGHRVFRAPDGDLRQLSADEVAAGCVKLLVANELR